MFSPLPLTILLAPPVVLVLWSLFLASSSPFACSFSSLHNKRICLLIAHPDDEAMFFAPTVLALTKPELRNRLKILCLSTGDADGLGHVRKKELQQSAKHLGIHNESDVIIINDLSRFPDNITRTWTAVDISSVLSSAFVPGPYDVGSAASFPQKQSSNTIADYKPHAASIDILLTFDQHGVSSHPNHVSLYHGAIHFLHTLQGSAEFPCPIALYTLTSTSILRKYIGILDAPLSMLFGVLHSLNVSTLGPGNGKQAAEGPSRLLFVSSVTEWTTALSAMISCHKSQMVWFRWGWISLGRYMAVNDLKQETI